MFIIALQKVSASVTDTIHITQVTFDFINNALMIYLRWFDLCYSSAAGNFLACEDWAQIQGYSLS